MSGTSGSRVAKNTVFLYMRMLVVMLINIFSVRYVLKGLGVVDYGVFNVVAGLVTMFASLSSIISSATLRFHSFAIGEGREDKVSDVFTASFNIYALLALVIFTAGEIVGIWFINIKADIPIDRMNAANWVFQFTMLTFVINLLTAPFSSLIFAYERMQVFSIISVVECVAKFLLAYSLLFLYGDHLVLYGIGLLVIQILQWLAYYLTSRYGGGEYHYKKTIEKGLYKQMLTFSGWTLFSSSASIGISQLVTMVTNVYFGPIVNAARAIAFQVNGAMNSFTGNIIMAVKPPMIKSYAEGNYSSVNNYFKFCNKAVYYSLLLVLLPIFLEMETVLYYWLDVVDEQTTLFCRLILVYALILALNNPISIIIQATGNIRAYSTYVEIPTLLCFPATWILYVIGYPAETAFYVMIIAIALSHIIRLICLKRVFSSFSYRDYAFGFLLPSSIVTIIVCAFLYLLHNQLPAGLSRLFVVLMGDGIALVISCWLIGFTRYEKNVLLNFFKRRSR
jgi:O-antigen/teichoic acid export membrane protein